MISLSLALPVVVTVPAIAFAQPTTYRVSHAGQSSYPDLSEVISGDGRHVAYAADGANGVTQVYLFNADTQSTALVSASPAGVAGSAGSYDPAVSYDGSFVAFASEATNLGPTSGSVSVYQRNTLSGTTTLVSAGANPNGGSSSFEPSITPDGRYVAFSSDASDLVSGDTNNADDAFIRDTTSGTTSRVSVGNNGAQANGNSWGPSVSADGRYVAFESSASNLILTDTNQREDVFVRDRSAGKTELVSQTSTGIQTLNGNSYDASISSDGQLVAFTSDALNLDPQDTNSASDIFLRDRTAKTTKLISWNKAGTASGNGPTYSPSISSDGHYLGFTSEATNLVAAPADSNGSPDVFRSTLNSGAHGTIDRVSVGYDGGDTTSDFGVGWVTSDSPTLSSTGRYVAFFSIANNLILGDPDSGDFLRDMGEKDPPQINSVDQSLGAFSPNGDGVEDLVTLSAGITDASPPITWTLTLQDSNNSVVRTFSGTINQTSGTASATWDGTTTNGVPVGDGVYGWTVRATDKWGNTSAPATSSVTVDRTPPAFSSSSPSPFQDVTSVGSISITWQDPLSGINPSSAQMSVDGSAVSASVSGNTVTANVSNLQPGIHQAVGQIADKAGNTTSQPFIFTDVSLTADSVTADLQGVTLPVNPSGKVPGPSTVTFHGIQVTAAQFHEFMNASTWVGYGPVGRQFNFGSLKVTFHNGTPLAATANATIPVSSFVQEMGALSPSASQLEAIVPGQTVTLPDFSVSVPTGYNTSGSTATLPSTTTQLGSPMPQGSLLGSQFHNSITVLGHIAACQERLPSGVNSFCTLDQTPGLQIQVPGSGPINGFSPLTAPLDQSNDAQIPPSCSSGCASSFDAIQARFVLGCSLYTIGGTNTSVDLCNGANASSSYSGKYFGSYVNGWIYTIPNGAPGGASTYPFWRQDHIDLGSDECPNGGSSTGSVVSTLSSAASDTTALDGASGPLSAGTWPGSLPFTVRLGASTGPTDASSNQGPSFTTTSRPYQLQNQNSLIISPKGLGYTIKRGATIDESGTQTNNPHATYNGWSSSSPVTDRLQLTNGTEFQTPAPAGGYAYLGLETFNVTLNFNC